MVDYGEINERLKSLAANYKVSRRESTGLAASIRDVSLAMLPSESHIAKLIGLLGGQRDAEDKVIKTLRQKALEYAKLDTTDQKAISNAKRKATALAESAKVNIAEISRLRGAVKALTAEQKKMTAGLTREKASLVEQSRTWLTLEKRIEGANRELKKRDALVTEAESKRRIGIETIANSTKAIRDRRKAYVDEASTVLKSISTASILNKTVLLAAKSTGVMFAVRQSQIFNKTLIEANSSLSVRTGLIRQALRAQSETGDSLESIAQTMVEIRAQSRLYDADMNKLVATASKLKLGLGASTQQVGMLLNVSRQLKLSFTTVANEVSNIVEKTSLSISDAVGLLADLREQMAAFHKDGANLVAAGRYVAALEESLRQVGATAGASARIIAGATDMGRGGSMAMAFGARGPDFGTDPEQLNLVLRQSANFLKQFRDNAWVFPQMAQSFGLTAVDAQNLINAQDKLSDNMSKLEKNVKTLDQRYKEQAAIAGDVYGQFFNSLKALTVELLTPLTKAVGWLNQALGALRTSVAWVKEHTWGWVKGLAALTASVGAVVMLTMATWSMIKAFKQLRDTMLQIAAMQYAGGGLRGAARSAAGGGPPGTGGLFQKLKDLVTGGRTRRPISIPGGASNAATIASQSFFSKLKGFFTGGGLRGTARAVAAGATRTGTAAAVSSLLTAGGVKAFLAANAATMVTTITAIALPLVATVAVGYGLRAVANWRDRQLQADIKKIRGTSGETLRSNRSKNYRATLDQRDAVGAAKAFSAQSAADLESLKKGLKSGKITVSGARAAQDEMRAQLKRRTDVQAATINREYKTAPAARRKELEEGMKALVSAMDKLNELQKADTNEYARINRVTLQRLEAERDETARRNAVHGMVTLGVSLEHDRYSRENNLIGAAAGVASF